MTIRAANKQEILKSEFEQLSDEHTKSFFSFIVLHRWFAIRIDTICIITSIIIIFLSILLKGMFNI